MDDINLERMGVTPPGNQWKSCSLQRGMAPPTNGASTDPNVIYGTVGARNPDGTLAIRRKASRQTIQDDEDPYGRCLNMKLTSFTENGVPVPNGTTTPGNARDPRIIDLTHSNASSTNNVSIASSSNPDPRPQGSPVHVPFQSPTPPQQSAAANNPQQFNTLPAQIHGGSGGYSNSQHGQTPGLRGGVQPPHHHHNTLPARVNGNGNNNSPQGLPPQSPRNNANHHGVVVPNGGGGAASAAAGGIYGPSGRHFKPFDHRRMNPMAEIQENPYGMHESSYGTIPENPVYGTTLGTSGGGVPGQPQAVISRPVSSAGIPAAAAAAGNLIVQKTSHLPHMPSELRHTNISNIQGGAVSVVDPQRKQQLVNPQVLEHHRDSANFSLNSSDSG